MGFDHNLQISSVNEFLNKMNHFGNCDTGSEITGSLLGASKEIKIPLTCNECSGKVKVTDKQGTRLLCGYLKTVINKDVDGRLKKCPLEELKRERKSDIEDYKQYTKTSVRYL